MTVFSLISLSIAMLVLASTPGPGVFATVARSLASGFRPALMVVTGIVLGDFVYLIFAIFGLAMIAQTFHGLFLFIKIGGGLYLIYMGIKMWRSCPTERLSELVPENRSRSKNLLEGLLITLSNPKVILFYCGFLPTFIDVSALKMVDMAMIAAVVTTVLGSVLIFYAWLASRTRRLFSNSRALKQLNRTAGGLMIATGVAITKS